MHNLFAILVILAAVVVLGVFRVPDENALVAAGIKAEAQAALYQARHPLKVEVAGREITVSGRVESAQAAREVVAQLGALDGVAEVVDHLTVLPNVAPFALTLNKDRSGWQATGHLPRATLAPELIAILGTPIDRAEDVAVETPDDLPVDLPLATGAPDRDWGAVLVQGAQALAALEQGALEVVDRGITLTGQAHLPADLRRARAALADLPEGYTLTLDVDTLDDGRPYAVLITRDPLTGLRLQGKLPPGTDLALFDRLGSAQARDLVLAPLPLDAPGFDEALDLALSLFDGLEAGVLSLSPGVLALQGGPLPKATIAQIAAQADQLPEGWHLNLSLIPQDSGAPLLIEADWDGAQMVLSGRVPLDFDLGTLGRAAAQDLRAGVLERSPYPDLSGWAEAQVPALRALGALRSGTLRMTEAGPVVQGVAADPLARQTAAAVLGTAAQLDVVLADDGRPPRFTLGYDAAKGASVQGKLPRGVRAQDLADALGLATIRGALPVSPDPARGQAALAALSSVAPWMGMIETLVLEHAPEGVALSLTTPPGVDAAQLDRVLAPDLPGNVALEVTVAALPISGTRRMHQALGLPQVVAAGLWLPQLGFAPDGPSCAQAADRQKDIPFEPGAFALSLGALHPFAHLVAVTRACTRLAGLTAQIEVGAEGSGHPALDRQLARRRVEALRAMLLERGVPEAQLTTAPKPQGAGLSMRFVQD